MRRLVMDVKDEISAGGPSGPTTGTTPNQGKARVAGGEVGAVHSSDEGGNDAGAKGPYLVDENSAGQDEAMAPFGEITTPPKVRKLQRTLYRKAKENKRWRAWSLYADLCRRDVLETALGSVLRNAGAAGVDGMTTEFVKASAAAFLDGLQTQLREKRYRPSPVLRVWIPKPDGKQRPLGIPTVTDRVVQAALRLLLEPIFEVDFNDASYGYRPKRSAQQAIDAITAALVQGKTEIIDADLSGYFDSIDHAQLLRLVARRVSDGSILKLVKLFLKAPIVERTQDGRSRITPNDRGTPQGGVISPLLANVYLNGLDHAVNNNPKLEAKLVRYADDFVLLTKPGRAAGLQERLKVYLDRKGLTLNAAKTRLLDIRQESLQFLGFTIRWQQSRRTGRCYPNVEPSAKARQKLHQNVRSQLNRWTTHQSAVATVRKLNQTVRGWSHYFHHGNSTRVFAAEQDWLRQRLRVWLWRKYDRTLSRWSFFTNDRLHGQYQLFSLPTRAAYLR
jgi:RNA-directed DNA polymerase